MITPSFGLTATERVLPKLALDFTTASLDSRVTFTRTTGASNPATYVGSDGYITAATNNQPRFDYDPVTLACKGLLIEESRINYATNSNNFATGGWTPSSVTLDPAGTTSPDGTTNGTKVIASASDALHFFSKNATSVPTTAYSFSIYAKKGALTKFALREGSATGAYAAFDLNAGTVLDGTGSIVSVGNGWYRCILNVTLVGTTFGMRIYLLPDSYTTGSVTNTWTGDATSELYLYGAQLEAGAFATSYIPTTTTALTRNADVATMTGTNFSDWFNASEGTLSVDIATNYPDAYGNNETPVIIWDGSETNSLAIWRNFSGTARFRVQAAGVLDAQLFSTGTYTQGTTKGAVLAYKVNNVAAAFNGEAVLTDTTVAMPTGINALSFSFQPRNHHLQKFAYYPQRLINAEVVATSK